MELSLEAREALRLNFAGRVEGPLKTLRELERAGMITLRSDGTSKWGSVTQAGWQRLHELLSE